MIHGLQPNSVSAACLYPQTDKKTVIACVCVSVGVYRNAYKLALVCTSIYACGNFCIHGWECFCVPEYVYHCVEVCDSTIYLQSLRNRHKNRQRILEQELTAIIKQDPV